MPAVGTLNAPPRSPSILPTSPFSLSPSMSLIVVPFCHSKLRSPGRAAPVRPSAFIPAKAAYGPIAPGDANGPRRRSIGRVNADVRICLQQGLQGRHDVGIEEIALEVGLRLFGAFEAVQHL